MWDGMLPLPCPADGQGLSQLWQAPRLRQLAQPFDGRDPAALQPEPPEGPHPGAGRRDAACLRLRTLPEVEQDHQSRLTTQESGAGNVGLDGWRTATGTRHQRGDDRPHRRPPGHRFRAGDPRPPGRQGQRRSGRMTGHGGEGQGGAASPTRTPRRTGDYCRDRMAKAVCGHFGRATDTSGRQESRRSPGH